MSYLNVIDRQGIAHQLETVEGWRLMEIMRDQNVGIDGLCGGACECATCHVILDSEWAAKVPTASGEELDKLDELPFVYKTSRLSCQILWNDALDGLKLTLAEVY